MRLITKAQFARERDVHPSRVSQWLRDGRIAETTDGKIDADEAHARLNAHLDQTKGMRRDGNITSSGPSIGQQVPNAAGPSGELPLRAEAAGEKPDDSGSRDDYWESKARREKAEAQLAEMKALAAAGALVPSAGVRKEAAETARRMRNALLAIADRLAPVLDPASPARAHKLLTSELQKVLRELSGGLEERAATAAREPDPALV
jgi:hypothetical protein